MSSNRLRISGAARLALGQTRTFQFEGETGPVSCFLLRHVDAGFVAYVNRCPHWSVDLDLGDERFYAEDIDRIYCKNHGALFRVSDGVCDHGPCFGEALLRFVVELDGDDAWVMPFRQS